MYVVEVGLMTRCANEPLISKYGLQEIKANKKRCREIIDKILRMSKSIYEKLAEVAQSDQRDKLSRLEGHLNDHER